MLTMTTRDEVSSRTDMSSDASESLAEMHPNQTLNDPNTCRICLKIGDIPIFGKDDISSDVNEFGGIEVVQDDNLPQHICDACYTLLEAAIVFRKTAQKSESILETESLNSYSVENDNHDYKKVLHKILGTEPDVTREYFECDDETGSEADANVSESEKDSDNDSAKEDTLSQDGIQDKNIEMQLLDLKDNNEGADIENDNMIMIIVSDKNKKESLNQAASILCEQCNQTFKSSEELKEHNSEKHSQFLADQKKCDVCFKMINKIEYRKHLKEHREKYTKKANQKYGKVECHICSKKISKSYYSYHIKLHGSKDEKAETMKACPLCEKKFSARYLSDHIQRVHSSKHSKVAEPEESEETLQCPVCDKEINKSKFKDHVANHGGSKRRYVCDQCGKVFKYPSPFKTHCLTHSGELKYKCQFCPYKGLHKALLKIHVRTHTGDYNYKCTECPARFITKSNLSKHLARHKGEYKFFCDVCNKGFYFKWNMDKHHLNVHSGKKDNICEICGKGYGHRDTMLSHQLKVHGRQKFTDCRGRVPSYLKLEQKTDLEEDL